MVTLRKYPLSSLLQPFFSVCFKIILWCSRRQPGGTAGLSWSCFAESWIRRYRLIEGVFGVGRWAWCWGRGHAQSEPTLVSLWPTADNRVREMNPFVSALVKRFACIRVADLVSGKHLISFKYMRIFVLISGKITNSKQDLLLFSFKLVKNHKFTLECLNILVF